MSSPLPFEEDEEVVEGDLPSRAAASAAPVGGDPVLLLLGQDEVGTRVRLWAQGNVHSSSSYIVVNIAIAGVLFLQVIFFAGKYYTTMLVLYETRCSQLLNTT